MTSIMKIIATLAGLFIGASLLSGSCVAFTTWYALPKELSNFIITLLTLTSLVIIINKLVRLLLNGL